MFSLTPQKLKAIKEYGNETDLSRLVAITDGVRVVWQRLAAIL